MPSDGDALERLLCQAMACLDAALTCPDRDAATDDILAARLLIHTATLSVRLPDSVPYYEEQQQGLPGDA